MASSVSSSDADQNLPRPVQHNAKNLQPSVQHKAKNVWYWRCQKPELRAFVKSRTSKSPPGRLLKEELIALLERLDEDATFDRFLDLAPELRNRVYELLLRHDRRAGLVAYPAILRTCKQIQREGASILNGDSIVRLDAHFFSQRRFYHVDPREPNQPLQNSDLSITAVHPFHVQYCRIKGDLGMNHQSHPEHPTYFDLSLRPLQSVQRMHIDLTLADEKALWLARRHIHHSFPRAFLQSLAKDCSALKELKISVVHSKDNEQVAPDEEMVRRAYIVKVFKPLNKFVSQAVKLEIEGLDEEMQGEVWEMLRLKANEAEGQRQV